MKKVTVLMRKAQTQEYLKVDNAWPDASGVLRIKAARGKREICIPLDLIREFTITEY